MSKSTRKMSQKPRRSVVGVALTQDQKQALLEAATAAGQTLSTYAAQRLVSHLTRTGRIPALPKAPRRTEDTAA